MVVRCYLHMECLQEPGTSGINACASGIPYWTSDIGGYHFHWQAPDWSTPNNRELFTRWFQFGTFSPIFRIHGKGERLYSPTLDATTKSILLNYDNLRYRLLPYIYSLAWKVTSEGYTIMRSLAFDFPDDAAIKSIPDQYMFGPAFMVSPVTKSLYSLSNNKDIKKTRKVYLRKWQIGTTSGQVIDYRRTNNRCWCSNRNHSSLYKGRFNYPNGPYLQYATEKLQTQSKSVSILALMPNSFFMRMKTIPIITNQKVFHNCHELEWSWKNLYINDRNGKFPGCWRKEHLKLFWLIVIMAPE